MKIKKYLVTFGAAAAMVAPNISEQRRCQRRYSSTSTTTTRPQTGQCQDR